MVEKRDEFKGDFTVGRDLNIGGDFVGGDKFDIPPRSEIGGKRFYQRWWFKLFLAPIIVAIIVGGIFMMKKNKKEREAAFYIGRDLNIEGDLVEGDKYEVNLSNSKEFKKLDGRHVDEIVSRLKALKEKYPNSDLKVLLNYYSADEGTKKFVQEFDGVMKKAEIPIRSVPIMVIGGQSPQYPLYFEYDGISSKQVKDFIKGISQLISTRRNGPVHTNLRPAKIPEDYNIVIKLAKSVYFDTEGKIFLTNNIGVW